MTLVGLSLHDLRKLYTDLSKQAFTLGTALSVGIQCVEAIEELHLIGYLHRDIKVTHYMMLSTNESIYSLGTSRLGKMSLEKSTCWTLEWLVAFLNRAEKFEDRVGLQDSEAQFAMLRYPVTYPENKHARTI
jgi:serine/threonine protein kinase